jgi:uncharacterized protein (DUF2252 family)
VWCAGDLHLQNFGSYKGDNRLVYFDINDFDEAALAPATWELLRFASSVLVACQTFEIPTRQARALVTRFVQAYAAALAEGKARWIERDTATGIAKELLDQLRERNRAEFLDGRTRLKRKTRRFLNDGVKTLKVSDQERDQVVRFMERFARTQPDPGFYRVLDVARRVAGTGSLGLARHAILVHGKGKPDRNYLLDLKLAVPSSLAGHFPGLQPRWSSDAERVVTLERRMQAVPMAFLCAANLGRRSFVLRELQPVEDRLPFERLRDHPDLFADAMTVMGNSLAWAHLRSSGRQGAANADALVDFAHGKKWPAALLKCASELASQARVDWLEYCNAYDDGSFPALATDG